MILLNGFLLIMAFFLLWTALTFVKMDDECYNKHRKLLLYPKDDIMGDTTTSLSMKYGKLKIKKRASIGATKRLLNNVWESE